MTVEKEINLCKCGSPFRDYDNRCLRCNKPIDPQRAAKLNFHREVSEIPICRCSEESKSKFGARSTLIDGLELCNFCNMRFGVKFVDPEEVAAKEKLVRNEIAAKALKQNIESEVMRIRTEARSGKTIYLYRSRYVSVDSYVHFGGKVSAAAQFNDIAIKEAGAQGWRVVEVIPRTAGETLENFEGFGKAWAGGIGGTIVGAYVLMEFAVTNLNVDTSEDLITEIVREYVTT